jgi:hypothetical protein
MLTTSVASGRDQCRLCDADFQPPIIQYVPESVPASPSVVVITDAQVDNICLHQLGSLFNEGNSAAALHQ